MLRGTVKNITDYGAFIDLGGIDGLLHITDMSWGRVGHPSEIFKVNDEVDVIVLKYDAATERVSLGHKQLVQDPWATVQARYPVGARMSGKVVSLTDYGAFVELEPGVEGLIHVSEMSWSKRVKHPSKILNVGDEIGKLTKGPIGLTDEIAYVASGAAPIPRSVFLQHLRAEGDDQPAALGDRDEVVRRDQAVDRVVPAHQGLDADDDVDLLAFEGRRERLDRRAKPVAVAQQRGDVVEENACLGEIRYAPDFRFE